MHQAKKGFMPCHSIGEGGGSSSVYGLRRQSHRQTLGAEFAELRLSIEPVDKKYLVENSAKYDPADGIVDQAHRYFLWKSRGHPQPTWIVESSAERMRRW